MFGLYKWTIDWMKLKSWISKILVAGLGSKEWFKRIFNMKIWFWAVDLPCFTCQSMWRSQQKQKYCLGMIHYTSTWQDSIIKKNDTTVVLPRNIFDINQHGRWRLQEDLSHFEPYFLRGHPVRKIMNLTWFEISFFWFLPDFYVDEVLESRNG